jgi:hypothetical protein
MLTFLRYAMSMLGEHNNTWREDGEKMMREARSNWKQLSIKQQYEFKEMAKANCKESSGSCEVDDIIEEILKIELVINDLTINHLDTTPIILNDSDDLDED